MIPKFICWILGHKWYADFYTGETTEVSNPLSGGRDLIPVVYRKDTERCQRCGYYLK